jgi:hypothetical protein
MYLYFRTTERMPIARSFELLLIVSRTMCGHLRLFEGMGVPSGLEISSLYSRRVRLTSSSVESSACVHANRICQRERRAREGTDAKEGQVNCTVPKWLTDARLFKRRDKSTISADNETQKACFAESMAHTMCRKRKRQKKGKEKKGKGTFKEVRVFKDSQHAIVEHRRYSAIPATFCDDSLASLDFFFSFCNKGSYLYFVPGGIVISMLPSPEQKFQPVRACAWVRVSTRLHHFAKPINIVN